MPTLLLELSLPLNYLPSSSIGEVITARSPFVARVALARADRPPDWQITYTSPVPSSATRASSASIGTFRAAGT